MQCHNLDTLGIICRSLDDLSLMRAALQVQPRRLVDRAAGAPRIGFCRTPSWDHASPDTQALLERTAARLSAAGAMVKDVAPVPSSFLEHQHRVFAFEAARNYAYEYEVHGDKLSAALRDGLLKSGRELPLSQYVEAIETAEAVRARLDDVFAEFDVLLAPSAVGEAPEGLELDRRRALQRDLDLGVDAVRDSARGRWPKGAAARHPARRPALPRRDLARRRRLGRGPSWLN